MFEYVTACVAQNLMMKPARLEDFYAVIKYKEVGQNPKTHKTQLDVFKLIKFKQDTPDE